MHFSNIVLGLGALAPLVSAHYRFVNMTVNGQVYQGANPYGRQRTPSANWRAENGGFGFVTDVTSPNITCHNGSTPGAASIPVAAGADLTAGWAIGFPHPQGFVSSYLAKCPGNCSQATVNDLKFFKIAEAGLLPNPNGTAELYWAARKVAVEDKGLWSIKLPTNIQAGNYVLRHEIVALHFARDLGGAQFYPTCVNLEISGGGNAAPAGVAANQLYKADEPGVLVNVYYPPPKNYKPPGPAIPAELSFDASSPPPTTPPPSSSAPAPPPSSSAPPPPPSSSTAAPQPAPTTTAAPPASTPSAPAPEPPVTTDDVPTPPAETPGPQPYPQPSTTTTTVAAPAPTDNVPTPPADTPDAPETPKPTNPLLSASLEQVVQWLSEYLAAQKN